MAPSRSILGVGPPLFGATGAWFLAMTGVQLALGTTGRIHQLTPRSAVVAGLVLLAAGVPSYLLTWRLILRARALGGLATTGPFAWVRHPLYALGILLLAPGVCVMLRSWFVMTTPIAMWAFARLLVPREERDLRRDFGADHDAYRRRVPMLFPWLRG